ncbi:hypothetical protein [Methanococcoides sp.]|uniref:hypothetical protein n=1 Tax=Methanococcoides sp. TaxID=1966350 RepID=UPI00272E051E|nr:hypothetical protein [Methanococcoides sp.]
MVIAAFVFGMGSDESGTNNIEIEDTGVEASAYDEEKSSPETETPISNAIQEGTYKVGSDIQPGLYKVIVKDSYVDMAYIDRSKDASMEFDSIIANGIISNSGYVRIKESDAYVKIQGATLYPEDTIETNIRDVFEDGVYLVGVDIASGTYKVEVTDTTTNMGYVERQSDVSMEFDDIIANEIFQGQGYVEIMSSDFSVKVQGATLTKD